MASQTRPLSGLLPLCLALPFLFGVVLEQDARTFNIDPAGSRVLIQVGHSGVFGFAGHDHEILAAAVSGRVRGYPNDWARSAVTLEFDSSKLKVTGKGEPASDVPDVQSVMLSERVLDVKRFPTVSFRSRRVTATAGTSGIGLVIEGDLTLHGVTRPLTVRSTVSLESTGLTARGTCVIRQTEFGMEPVTAAGGTIKVKDELRVDFVLKARESI
jgi:polyisoprenoid-binding protein YceI